MRAFGVGNAIGTNRELTASLAIRAIASIRSMKISASIPPARSQAAPNTKAILTESPSYNLAKAPKAGDSLIGRNML
jgi:hypothetical protein